MAHETVQRGLCGRRECESRLDRNASGPSVCIGLRALTLAGMTLTLALGSLAHAQQPAAVSPYAGAAAPAQQPPKPAGQPERVGGPRPVNEAPIEAPPPRLSDPFGEAHPRLRGLGINVQPPVGTTPIPTKEDKQQEAKYVDRLVDPKFVIELVEGRPRLMYLKEVAFRIQVGDENIMTYNIIGQTPRELSLLGRRVGTTVMNLWFGDRDDLSKQTVLSYQVNIVPDPEAKERLERIYKALEDEINRAFPDAQVCLFLVGDKVVLTGQVKDAVEATKILQIVRSNVAQSQFGRGDLARDPRYRALFGGQTPLIPVNQVDPGLPPGSIEDGGQAGLGLDDYIIRSDLPVINMLRIPGEQQVMLKVVVAEMSRAAARSIGVNFTVSNDQGMPVFSQLTGGLLSANNGATNTGNLTNTTTGQTANLLAFLDNRELFFAIQALRTNDLARSLAEPNLVTINGRPATFRAGGEFPVPVVTGATATGLTGVSFVPFGVQVAFTPIITDKDRVRLQVEAEVSTRDVATGANFGTGNVGNTFVPGLTTRTISTTVEMREGQTLAIGGLLETNMGGHSTKIPLFGDIPFGGQFFRNDQTQNEEREIVMLVTPELVHPMEPKEVPPLPGSDYFEPGDLEFYLTGKLESRRSYDYRSTVMTDLHRMAAYRHCELLYFVGPHGHCDGR